MYSSCAALNTDVLSFFSPVHPGGEWGSGPLSVRSGGRLDWWQRGRGRGSSTPTLLRDWTTTCASEEGETSNTKHSYFHTQHTHMYVIFTLQVRDRAATSGSRFSLLDALQHGYFSDLTVQSSSGEQVYYTQQQREGVREKSHCIICFVSI